MSSQEINYAEKLSNFQAMTENADDEVALKYLEMASWDEAVAVQLYFDSTSTNKTSNNQTQSQSQRQSQSSNLRGNYDYSHPGIDPFSYMSSQNSNTHYDGYYENQNTSSNNQSSGGFFGKIFGTNPLAAAMGGLNKMIFGSNGTSSNSDSSMKICKNLDKFPFKVNSRTQFVDNLRSKIGIAIFYQDSDINFINKITENIAKTDYIVEILKENFVVHLLNTKNPVASEYLGLLNDQIEVPSMIFFQRTISKSTILFRLLGEVSFDMFRDTIFKLLEKNGIERTDKQLSNDDLIKRQMEELQSLEFKEELKRKKEREELERLEKEEQEKLIQAKAREEIKTSKEKVLPPEPDSSDPNSTLIVFRYPDWSTRKERRFLKTEKVQVLYDFVDSLGHSIFQESENYDLVQSMPFKLYDNKEKTLQEEGLFPNAILQIREI